MVGTNDFTDDIIKVKSKRKRASFVLSDEESTIKSAGEKSVPKPSKRKVVEEKPSQLPKKELPKATSISSYFAATNRAPPKRLGERPIPRGADDCLVEYSFVITGILELIERDDAVSLIKRHGGKVMTNISGRTSFIVLGREPGPAKLEKIKKFGTKTISDAELFDMIEATSKEVSTQEDKKDSISKEPKAIKKSEPPAIQPTLSNASDELWVDKYKPKSISSIIGQNGQKSAVNKLLSWLSNWSKSRISSRQTKEDGSMFKAAILSGPPGIGKTTSAILCCQQLNLDYIELNASDTRNKSLLKNLLNEFTTGTTFTKYFNNVSKNSHVVIMDEVDGISGNMDRGGLPEVIQLIKKTKIPIICICNDRMSQKIRSLTNYCFDLRFMRPRIEQAKAHVSSICFKENLKLLPQAIDQLIIGCNYDLRQVINRLQILSGVGKSVNYDEIVTENKLSYKDTDKNIFEVARELLNKSDSAKLDITDKLNRFFVDYSLMPLFIQENYPNCVIFKDKGVKENVLKKYAQISNLIALSTKADVLIRSTNNWSMLPGYGMLSTVLPTSILNGALSGMVAFPQWLGKNSTQSKNARILDQLALHMRINTAIGSRKLINETVWYMDYFLRDPLTDPECTNDGGLEEVIDMMTFYRLTREDWDLIHELALFEEQNYKDKAVPTKVKTAFTRKLNSKKRIMPYNMNEGKVKKSYVMAEEMLIVDAEEEIESASEPELIATPVADKKAPRKRPIKERKN